MDAGRGCELVYNATSAATATTIPIGATMKNYPVPAQLLQEIANYLQRQPWVEVNNFLAAIQQIVMANNDQAATLKGNARGEDHQVQ
jgi:hypothetical protein